MHEKYKVMLVDDEPDILEILEYNLNNAGYQTITAENGEIALQIAAEFKPDVIILDMMMPILDGIETCKLLRQNPDFQKTLILFLTARGEDFTQIKALEVGGDDFITKPISPKVLISRIKALTRVKMREGGESIQTNIYKFDDLKINVEKRSVKLGGRKLKLTRKEFNFLHLLVSKPNKVFSRKEIFLHVWGSDILLNTRTIDVHVKNIRDKLDKKYIKTEKGIGYKFVY